MFARLLNRHYRRPTGLLGRYVGWQMARDHHPENLWTVAILDPRPTDHILEIGFGAGVAIEALIPRLPEGFIAGIDYSRAMVRAAQRRNAPAVAQGRVELHYAEATSLPFSEASFDKVFSIHSIYFWPRPRQALKAIRRVLKPQGLVFLTILPKEKWPLTETEAGGGIPDCTPYSGEEVARLLIAAGFAGVRFQADPDPAYPANYCVIGVK